MDSGSRPSASHGILKRATAYLVLVTLSTIWGVAFVAIRVADFQLSPVNLALVRWLIAGVLFLSLAPIIARPKASFRRSDIPRLLVVAFANVIGYHISLNFAETSTSAGLAGLLISISPVFVVMLSMLFLNERADSRVVVALVLAISGALVLSVDSPSLNGVPSLAGPVEVVLAAAFYALFGVLGKPLVQRYGAASTTVWSGLIGTTMMLPLLSGSLVSQLRSLSTDGWLSVLYLSVVSTVLGYLLFYTLVGKGAVSRVSIQLYLVPVVSVVSGALILGEQLTVLTLVGGGLMLASVGLVTGRKARKQ